MPRDATEAIRRSPSVAFAKELFTFCAKIAHREMLLAELLCCRGCPRSPKIQVSEPYIAGPEICQKILDHLVGAAYSHVRLFHSNATQPRKILTELIPLWRTSDVMQLFAEKRIGAYGTLWATPDAQANAGVLELSKHPNEGLNSVREFDQAVRTVQANHPTNPY